jgi:hypothetical protein
MAFDREAAKQAGYSDAEIDAYLSEEANKKKTAPAPAASAEASEPPAPTTVVPDAGGGAKGLATSAGLAAAPYLAPAAAGVAGAYGANKLYGAWKQSAQAAQALADAKLTSEQGIAQRAAARAMPVPTAPVAPVAPSPILDASGRPMASSVRGPVAPVAPAMAPPTAAPVAQAGLLDKTTAMIRQLAASKAVQGASRLGGVAGAAMYSPELGPAVPKSGRMRGMEINPVTGRPWTPEQIQQYEANPSIYDAQLGAPQFQR